jgi:hypothetical protein
MDERVAAGRNDVDILKPNAAQLACQPMRALFDVPGVAGLGADRRKADEFLELGQ